MYRPTGRYRRAKHRKSPTSSPVTRGRERRLACAAVGRALSLVWTMRWSVGDFSGKCVGGEIHTIVATNTLNNEQFTYLLTYSSSSGKNSMRRVDFPTHPVHALACMDVAVVVGGVSDTPHIVAVFTAPSRRRILHASGERVCQSVRLSVSPPVQTLPSLPCALSVAEARSFSNGVAMRYVFPVLQMTSIDVMGNSGTCRYPSSRRHSALANTPATSYLVASCRSGRRAPILDESIVQGVPGRGRSLLSTFALLCRQDLISKLLVLDAGKRLTAVEALDHPWVRGNAAQQRRC